MTAATVVRRVLFTLAPIEIGLAVAIFAGATIPPPLRIAIAVLVLITVLVEISILAAKIHGLCRGGAGFRRATVQAGREVIGERLWGLHFHRGRHVRGAGATRRPQAECAGRCRCSPVTVTSRG